LRKDHVQPGRWHFVQQSHVPAGDRQTVHFSIDVSPARKRASSFVSPTFGLLAEESADANVDFRLALKRSRRERLTQQPLRLSQLALCFGVRFPQRRDLCDEGRSVERLNNLILIAGPRLSIGV